MENSITLWKILENSERFLTIQYRDIDPFENKLI